MKTAQLIDLLSTGVAPVRRGQAARRVAVAGAVGLCSALVLMAALLGVRHDWAAALQLPMFWVKLAFAASLVAGGALLTARLGQPGRALGSAWAVALAPVIVVWAAALYVLLAAAPVTRPVLLLGSTWLVCPWLIALLSVPAFVAALWVQRGLAPTRPRAAGAAAGLFAGALATLVYALHCPEMALPFVGLWYVLGIALPTAAGALLGPRLLRW
jgi:hypothetical protein